MEKNTVFMAGKTAAEAITASTGYLVLDPVTGALKVVIDQTTPGTTDSVTVKSSGHGASVILTRPATTPTYSIGAAIGDTNGSAILTFSNMCKAGGGEVLITSITLELDIDSSTCGSFTLLLFNASPTAIADTTVWDFPSGDRGKFLTQVGLLTPTDKGSTLISINDNINKQITMTGTDLYAVLTTDTSFVATSSAVKVIGIHTVDL